jgi:hypothetical protein
MAVGSKMRFTNSVTKDSHQNRSDVLSGNKARELVSVKTVQTAKGSQIKVGKGEINER